jgi:hypothetical protein
MSDRHIAAGIDRQPVGLEVEQAVGSGTETYCPLVGVHEHAFRGPHRFREWYEPPAALDAQPDGLDVERLAKALDRYWTKRYGPAGNDNSMEPAKEIAAEYAALASLREPQP